MAISTHDRVVAPPMPQGQGKGIGLRIDARSPIDLVGLAAVSPRASSLLGWANILRDFSGGTAAEALR